MPVVNTTSPVAACGAPQATPSKRVPSSSRTNAFEGFRPMVIASSDLRTTSHSQARTFGRRYSCRAQDGRPLAVGDGARGDRQQHLAGELAAREAVVLRAALIAALPHDPPRREVDEHEVGLL